MHLLDRRRVGIVLAFAAASAIVALAARDDRRDGSGFGIPERASATLQATILILFALLAIGVFALTIWAVFPDGKIGKIEPRRRTRTIVGAVVALVLFMTLFAIAGGGGGDEEPLQPALLEGAPAPPTASGDGERTEPNWALGAAGVVLLLGVVGVVALRRRPPPLDLLDDAEPVIATDDERVDAAAAAEQCTDPRRAVLLAFAAAEAVLSGDASTRRPAATSAREWARVVRSTDLSTIVGRYEIARFSHHAVSDDDRRVALEALGRLR